MSKPGPIGQQHQAYTKWANRFHMEFGRPLKDFWHPVFGFEVFEFDDWIIQEKHWDYMDGHTSLRDFIEAWYGKEVAAMLMELT
jgi:hypothetical protein